MPNPSAKARNYVSIPSNQAAEIFLLQVKTITKSPWNGIAEFVKSRNLHEKSTKF